MDSNSESGSSYRRVSRSLSPIVSGYYPPSSYASETDSKRRSPSLSRARDSLRRASINIQHKVHTKLLQLTEQHCDPSVIEGARGVVYHVPETPGNHSSGDVVRLLDQSIQWMRNNPDKNVTPYNQSPVFESFGSHLDLLDQEMVHVELPTSPSDPQNCESLADPISLGMITKMMTFQSDTHVEQDSCPSTPVEFCSKQESHHEYTSYTLSNATRSTGSQQSSPTRSASVSTTMSQGDMEEEGAAMNGQEMVDPQHDRSIPTSLRPAAVRARRKPTCVESSDQATTSPLVSPSSYLGVGLRPVVQSTSTAVPSLVLTAAPPETARRSREVLERRDRDQLLHRSQHVPRQMSQNFDDRDFKPLKLLRPSDARVRSSRLRPIEEQNSEGLHIPGSNSVAEKISRFEEPSSPLSLEVVKPSVVQHPRKRRSLLGSIFRRRQSQKQDTRPGTQVSQVPLDNFEPCRQVSPSPVNVDTSPSQSKSRSRSSSILQVTDQYLNRSLHGDDQVYRPSQGRGDHLYYVPYSPTQDSSNSLEQANPRVHRMRKQFEGTNDDTEWTPPAQSKAAKVLGRQRTPTPQRTLEERRKSFALYANASSSVSGQDHCDPSSPTTFTPPDVAQRRRQTLHNF